MGENERQWGVGQKELEGESRRWRGRMRHGERQWGVGQRKSWRERERENGKERRGRVFKIERETGE